MSASSDRYLRIIFQNIASKNSTLLINLRYVILLANMKTKLSAE